MIAITVPGGMRLGAVVVDIPARSIDESLRDRAGQFHLPAITNWYECLREAGAVVTEVKGPSPPGTP